MVGERKSQKMKQQVLELYKKGHGKRRIAQMLGISKNTVKGILRGPGHPDPESPGTDPESSKNSDHWSEQVSWDRIQGELGKRYTTFKCLHEENAPSGVSYLRFWRELKRRFPENLADQARIRFQYAPGERVEIDYCDGISIVDRLTGLERKTHLFAAVSASSDLTFGEFSFSQKQEEFIASHDRMHHFFGGVFKYVVVDNLKSAVHRAHTYDPDTNPVYLDYANHMGFAVLPARPRTPRDKPAIEATIGVIQRQFFAEVRNRIFYSLQELNVCFREYLKRLNHSVMKDYGVSRNERFLEEKPSLSSLPQSMFEVFEYRMAKVHPDCHIQVQKNFYSVPYSLIGQTLRVKVSPRLVEVFNSDHESVAVHTRYQGRGKFATNDHHYPEQKLAAIRFDLIHAKREAEKIGPETLKLIEELLAGPHPLKYLRRIQGILRLRKIYSASAMEYACHQALVFNRPRLSY